MFGERQEVCRPQDKLIHPGERPFNCDYCNKKLILQSHLEIHMINDLCSVCGKGFKCLDNFRSHQKMHAGMNVLYDHISYY